jgi:phosphoribosyl-AMP cyclohydrolase/adenine/guanine phosphoribosyltransferase-like PRPP-binding protein
MKTKRIVRIEDLKFNKDNLVPVIVQDFVTERVLMTAYANKEAINKTLETGKGYFWSRSRNKLWMKGETSGNFLNMVQIRIDCDNDTVLYLVEPHGPTCHTGNVSCFINELQGSQILRNKYDADIISEITSYYGKSKVVKRHWVKGNSRKIYEFILNRITDHVPPPSPRTLSWIANEINNNTSDEFDKIVVPEVLGLPIGTLIAQMKGKPIAIVRKRTFGTDNYLLDKVEYSSGYEKGKYYIYGVKPGERILIVDDTISTGGTLISLINTFHKHDVKVVDVVCIIETEMYKGKQKVQQKFGIQVKTIIKVRKKGKKMYCTVER